MMVLRERFQGQEVIECDLCQKPVSFFCRRCWLNLCDSCVPKHLRATRKTETIHVVVDYMRRDDDDTCLCELHPKHECSAYCKTCNGPICKLCVSDKHKSHEISELSDKRDTMKYNTRENVRLQSFRDAWESPLVDTIKKLFPLLIIIFFIIVYVIYQRPFEKGTKYFTAPVEEGCKLFNFKHQKELEDLKKESDMTVKKQKKELEDMIGNVKNNHEKPINYLTENVTGQTKELHKLIVETLQQELEDFKRANDVAVEKQKRELKDMIGNVKIHQKSMDDLKKENNAALEDMTRNEKKHYQELDDLKKKNKALLQKQREFEKIIKKLEQRVFPAAYHRIIEEPSVLSVIDTRKKNDILLYDITVTDDKRVWVVGSSRELKLFDLQGTLHHTVPISWSGKYICMYNKQVVFIDNIDKKVKRIADDYTVVKMFTTEDWRPHGITGSTSGNLLVCLCKTNQIKIVRYSSTGAVLQEIQYHSQAKSCYAGDIYIAENVNRDIIVTDSENGFVTAVNRLGIFRYSYSREESSFSPRGVVTDSVGHVLIADFGSDKIHMLDRDGRFLAYIIPKRGLNGPIALAIINDSELIIGEWKTGLIKTIKYLEKKN